MMEHVRGYLEGDGHRALDPAGFDHAVRPQDDMFRHVNGVWLARTDIPADRAVYGTFVEIADRTELDLRALVEELAASTDTGPDGTTQQVRDLYRAFMDEEQLERLGISPLTRHLAAIDAIEDTVGLARVLGDLAMIGVPGPVTAAVDADAGDPARYALYLGQGGTTLPDRDYYLLDEPRFVEIRAQYLAYLEGIFVSVGRHSPTSDARAVLALETRLAQAQWTAVDSRDALRTYNRFVVAELAVTLPGFDWDAWSAPQGVDTTAEWIIAQPSFFEAFAAMVPTTPLAVWKVWLTARLVTTFAPLLHRAESDARFAFFGRTLTGQQTQRDRWKRGVALVNESLGEALGRIYVSTHFPPAARARMDSMIEHLIEAYRRSIGTLDWMTPATRQQALAKLEKFTSKVGYPDRWRDYSALRIVPGDLVGNVERARRFEAEYQIAKLTQPVDRNDWQMTPQTVNAYYNPVTNEIVFPAAILQPPFFDLSADDAVNYGAIGSIIGHEIGHGFDDQGRRFDGDGRLTDWWTAEDEAEFQKRTGALVQQFSAYSPLPGTTVNGELTLGENIGDLGGVSIAYQAWRLSLGDAPAPVVDGLTGDQRFFMGWVQAWRAKARDAYLHRQVLADPHTWAEFRANGPLTNIDAFHTAFGVGPGDALWREPAARVRIW
jgi:putative endopeptidase